MYTTDLDAVIAAVCIRRGMNKVISEHQRKYQRSELI
jgi:hypothetical protein